jgi:DNA relaxase NicK
MRDIEITIDLLTKIKEKYHHYADIFIDKLCNVSSQETVLCELSMSNIVILLKTQNVMHSKWVRYELDFAKSRNIPVIEYNPIYFVNQTPEKIIRKVNNILIR